MGHFVMVSVWSTSLSTNARFRFLYFRMNNCLAHMMLHEEKELPNISVILISPIKNKMAATKKQCFFAFSVLN